MGCIFCRIVAGEVPAEVVAREAEVVAFLDVEPLADGHVLVVPRAHAHPSRTSPPRPPMRSSAQSSGSRAPSARRWAPPARPSASTTASDGADDPPRPRPHRAPLAGRRRGERAHDLPRNVKRKLPDVGAAIRKAMSG